MDVLQELLVSYTVLALLRARLAVEELGPPLVEVDELLGVLASLGFILHNRSCSVIFIP